MPPRSRCPRLFADYALLQPLAEARAEGVFLATTRVLARESRACVVKIRRLPAGRTVPRLASVLHPCVVHVTDSGQVHDEAFVALEWKPGRDLLEVWNRCAQMRVPIPVGVSCRIIADTLTGLAAMHDGGRTHGHLCPSKLLVGVDGVTVLAEAGLRDALHGAGPGFAVGRFGYVAPVVGGGGGSSRSSDIYAAGVILWELLAARPLWGPQSGGRNATKKLPGTMLAEIGRSELEPPSRQQRRVPKVLDGPVLRALAREPRLRFPNVREFLEAIEATGVPLASPGEVATFVRRLFGQELAEEQWCVRELVDQGSALLGTASAVPSPDTSTPPQRPVHRATELLPEYPLPDLDEPLARQRGPEPRKQTPVAKPAAPKKAPAAPPIVADSGQADHAGRSGAHERAGSRSGMALLAIGGLLAVGAVVLWLLPDRARRPGSSSLSDNTSSKTLVPNPTETAPLQRDPKPLPPVTAPTPAATAAPTPTGVPAAASNAEVPQDAGRREDRRSLRGAGRERGRALLVEAQDAYDHSNFSLAIKKASRAVDAGAGAEALVVMGDAYLAAHEGSRAAVAYRKALKANPNSEGARRGLREALSLGRRGE